MLPSEAKPLILTIASGGDKAPKAFKDLLQMILVNATLAENESIKCSDNTNVRKVAGSKAWIIESKKIGMPLRLRDNRYLYLRYELDLSADNRLSVIESSMQYQNSLEKPFGKIFRYDYERQSPVSSSSYQERKYQLPESHFHIYGSLYEKDVFLRRELLERQHFVCGRVSLESIIRMLIRDFMIKPKAEDVSWLDLIDTTEKAFKYQYDPALVHV